MVLDDMWRSLVVMAGLLIALLIVPAFGQDEERVICECPGPEGSTPVCGVDGQTYGNECLLNCSNIKLASQGPCELDGCYPWGAPDCTGNFDDVSPVCALGLTWINLAEAKCAGTAKSQSCTASRVCGYRADGKPDYLDGKGVEVDIVQVAANTEPPSKTNPPYNYGEALAKVLLFYDSMISGKVSTACRRRLTWRDDSCSSCKGTYGEDLSGGFYEAGGSTLKYPSIISGFSATMLAWSGIEFQSTMERTGVLDDLKWKVKWAADHVIAAHPEQYVFAAFLGNSTDDFDFWGPPEYYEKYNPPRMVGYVTKDEPGSEALADAAATLAAALTLGVSEDSGWKANALQHAKELYDWAKTNPGSYNDAKSEGMKMMAQMYSSNNGFWDDLSWAATWMYKATGEQQYLDDAKEFLNKAGGIAQAATFETGYKTPGAAILLAKESEDANALSLAEKYFNSYMNGDVAHTKAGAAYPYHWGALRHAGNLGFLTFVHAGNPAVDEKYSARLRNYGAHQTNYLLGDSGRSWMVGFGDDYPQYVNHKMSYNSILTWNEKLGEKVYMVPPNVGGPWAPENPGNSSGQYIQRAKFDYEGSYYPQKHIAWGTIFGAPLRDDGRINSRRDYTYAEPTVEYNAGATGAIAALADWFNSPKWENDVESLEGVIPFSCETTLSSDAPQSTPEPTQDVISAAPAETATTNPVDNSTSAPKPADTTANGPDEESSSTTVSDSDDTSALAPSPEDTIAPAPGPENMESVASAPSATLSPEDKVPASTVSSPNESEISSQGTEAIISEAEGSVDDQNLSQDEGSAARMPGTILSLISLSALWIVAII